MEDVKYFFSAEDVWDYYCEKSGRTDVLDAKKKSWIEGLRNNFNDEDIKYVLDNDYEVSPGVLLTTAYMRKALAYRYLETSKAKEDTASVAASLSILSNALVESIKSAKGDELIQYCKDFIESNYGITGKKVEWLTVKGEKINGITHEKFQEVCDYVSLNEPVMLIGPAGTGKNVLCKQVAEAYHLNYFSANAVQQPYDLTGFIDANGAYHETEFYKACKSASDGQDTLFVFDEIDGSNQEVMVMFNDALANGNYQFPNETLNFSEHLKVIACANTFGTGATMEYVGRNQLDAATLDRFASVVIDYSPAIEESLCPDNELLSFLRDFRNKCVDAGINHIISYRGIKRTYKIMQVRKDRPDGIENTLKECIIKNLEPNDLSMICNRLNRCKYTDIIRKLANS